MIGLVDVLRTFDRKKIKAQFTGKPEADVEPKGRQ